MRKLLGVGEELVRETKMWYYAPSSGIFDATWRPGRLCLTNKRLFWLHQTFGKVQFEQSTDKIIGATLERRKTGHARRSEIVLVVTYETDEDKDEELFSAKTSVLKKWLTLLQK